MKPIQEGEYGAVYLHTVKIYVRILNLLVGNFKFEIRSLCTFLRA